MIGQDPNQIHVSPRYRYVEDYEVRTEVLPSGKKKKILVYHGPWMEPQHGEADHRCFRRRAIVTAVLCPLTVLLLLSWPVFAIHRYEGLYTLFPAILSLFPAVYLIDGTAALPAGFGSLQKDKYQHSVQRISRSAGGMMVLLALTVLLSVVFALTKQGVRFSAADLLYAAALAATEAAAVRLFLSGRKLRWTERKK